MRVKSMDNSGFSLVETLVALAILGAALPALYTTISGSLDRDTRQASRVESAYLAASLLDRVGLDIPAVPGVTEGDYWWLEIAPFNETARETAEDPMLYRVTATVATGSDTSLRMERLHFGGTRQAP